MAWPLIKYLPAKTNFKFVGFAIFAGLFSVLAVIGSLTSILLPLAQGQGVGFNLGIDFKGGILVEFASTEVIDLDAVRARVGSLQLGEAQLQNYEGGKEVQLRFAPPDRMKPAEAVQLAQDSLRDLVPGIEFKRVEVVGPQVSKELLEGGVWALVLAIALMMVYVWFRFECSSALAQFLLCCTT